VRSAPRTRSPAFAAALAAAVLAAAAPAATPKTQTFEPRGLAIRFSLPSDWSHNEPFREKDVGFQSQAPAHVAELKIGTFHAPSPSSTIRQLVTAVSASIRRTDPTASVATRATRVGGASAVELRSRYHGVGPVAQVPGERLALVVYFVEHHDIVYLVQYLTTVRWLPKEKPIFDASVRSLRFVNVA